MYTDSSITSIAKAISGMLPGSPGSYPVAFVCKRVRMSKHNWKHCSNTHEHTHAKRTLVKF